MSDCASPPPDRATLIDNETIFRLGRSSSTSSATPLQLEEAFVLSSDDKKQRPPLLSVWAERLSRPDQAVLHFPGTGTFQVLPLLVGDVARFVLDESQAIAGLQVLWDHHPLLNRDLPAWCAHAGIAGMDGGSKTRRKVIRSALCDLVNRHRPFAVVSKPRDPQIEGRQ